MAQIFINPKSRGIKLYLLSTPAHTCSSSPLVMFLYGATFQALLKSPYLPVENMERISTDIGLQIQTVPIDKTLKYWCCVYPKEVAERLFCLQQVRGRPAISLGIGLFPLAFWFTAQSIGFCPLLPPPLVSELMGGSAPALLCYRQTAECHQGECSTESHTVSSAQHNRARQHTGRLCTSQPAEAGKYY